MTSPEVLPKDRVAAAIVGGVLVIGTFALMVLSPVTPASSVVEAVFAIGGVALLLYAVVYDRLKSVGPKGVELFKRRTVDRAIEVIGPQAPEPWAATPHAPPESVGGRAEPALGYGQAGSAVANVEEAADAALRAKTPEEFADRLVALVRVAAGSHWPSVRLGGDAAGSSTWVPRDPELGEPPFAGTTYAIEVLRPVAAGTPLGVQVSRMQDGRPIDHQMYDPAPANAAMAD